MPVLLLLYFLGDFTDQPALPVSQYLLVGNLVRMPLWLLVPIAAE
jgi:hypothetical protein